MFRSTPGWLGVSTLSVGAVNLFNSMPKFSNYSYDYVGYDPSQYDIRGRFVFARLQAKW